MPQDRPQQGLGSWRFRRLFLWVVNAFSAFVVIYILAKELDTRPADTAMMMAFLVILGSVGSYVFGAVWDDANKMQFLGARLGDRVDEPREARRVLERKADEDREKLGSGPNKPSEDELDKAMKALGDGA